MLPDIEKSILIFKIGDKECCMGLEQMAGAVNPQKCGESFMGSTGDFLCISNYGKNIPLLNIHKYFDELPKGDLADKRILLINISSRVIGVWVDKITEIITIDCYSDLKIVEFLASDNNSKYLGVLYFEKRPLFIPDLKKIIDELTLNTNQQGS